MGLFFSKCRLSISSSELAHQGSVQPHATSLRLGGLTDKEYSHIIQLHHRVIPQRESVVPQGETPLLENQDTIQQGITRVHEDNGAVEGVPRPPSAYMATDQRALTERYRGVDWDTVRDEYDGYIVSYVNQCPFHLFDTQRQRNITRSELKDDITAALRCWIQVPLTCSEVMDIISQASSNLPQLEGNERLELIRPYVYAAMSKNQLIDEVRFIATLDDELHAFNSICASRQIFTALIPVPIDPILTAVRELLTTKQTLNPVSTHHIREQVEIFGQYAILSHRWCQDGQELCFDDLANISDPTVQGKQGFQKLVGFSRVVQSYYGCRYLWVDSICIDETDRNASIPLMFGWYRHAYACVIYLANSSTISEDTWSTRGWTLQEFLAASRIKCFASDWRPVACNFEGDIVSKLKFDACRGYPEYFPVYDDLQLATGGVRWQSYTSGADEAFWMFIAMGSRQTLKPEDMVYSLISALDLDIPLEYGEGFDSAFCRLQVAILTQTHYRHILSWMGNADPPSHYNSMLAGSFQVFDVGTWAGWAQNDDPGTMYPKRTSSGEYFDPTISFDANGVMRIMVSLHSLRGLPEAVTFALMGRDFYNAKSIGILLRRLPGPTAVYQRVGIKECKISLISNDQTAEWVYIK